MNTDATPAPAAEDTANEMKAGEGQVSNSSADISLGDLVQLGCVLAALYFGAQAVFGPFNFHLGENRLEKALVIGKSTRSDFSKFRDEGGLDNSQQNLWKGYSVTNVRLSFDGSEVLQGMTLTLMKVGSSGKVASISNLKSTLSSICPDGWQDLGDAQVSRASSSCSIIEQSASGSVEVTVVKEGA